LQAGGKEEGGYGVRKVEERGGTQVEEAGRVIAGSSLSYKT